MNQYILHHLTDYSIDEERLKILCHTPYLFRNFHGMLTPIESTEKGGFLYIKQKRSYNWDKGLYCACRGGHSNIVKLMIEKGANNWDWGFYGACEGGKLDLVKLMIEKGANNWNDGLVYACEGGRLNTANFMIEKGANNWNYGLRGACYLGHLSLANLMIEKCTEREEEGGDATDCNEGLEYACAGKRPTTIRLMIEKGATECYNCSKSLQDHLSLFS